MYRITAPVILMSILVSCMICSGSTGTIKTPGEENNYSRFSQYEDIIKFLSALSALSPNISIQVAGHTSASDKFPARDIILCILSQEGAGTPDKLNRSKPTLLLIASQHGNEQSAKEAALEFIRDLALGELRSLLSELNFLIIPQANPYGNFYDQRENELGLDLNRDHIKLESQEVQAIHRIFRRWLPEVTLDIHERGDNYYRIALGCVSNINIQSQLQEISRQCVLAEVDKKLEQAGITFHEYLVEEEKGLNTAAGAGLRPEDTAGREMILRYSTSDINDMRNSMGIYQTLSFIQECASRHDLATLAERTDWQYNSLKAISEVVAAHDTEIINLVSTVRKNLLSGAQVYTETAKVHLKLEYARDEQRPVLTIKEFKHTDSLATGIMKVDRNSGEVLFDSDVAPYSYPSDQKVITSAIQNWFPRVIPKQSITRPLGYILPASHQDVIETLQRSGIEVSLISQDCETEVEAYEVSAVVPAKYDYLPPEKIEVLSRKMKLLLKKGDFFINCAQPAANLIPCLLEPQSDYGLIRYWKFRLVPEQGNVFAFYRITTKQNMHLIGYQPWLMD
jgi:hypothetical protein